MSLRTRVERLEREFRRLPRSERSPGEVSRQLRFSCYPRPVLEALVGVCEGRDVEFASVNEIDPKLGQSLERLRAGHGSWQTVMERLDLLTVAEMECWVAQLSSKEPECTIPEDLKRLIDSGNLRRTPAGHWLVPQRVKDRCELRHLAGLLNRAEARRTRTHAKCVRS
jgi:hypothetical protein